MPWLLLLYATTTQALSATTAQVINGSEPYLTFDKGVTKVTTTDALLWIMLSDGTSITPVTNTSTAGNPIVLPEVNQSFTDIDMLVPTTTNSIALSTLIGAPNNYWGDDDGDGQGSNGIVATGNLSVIITDKDNQTVSRSASLDICQAPYKVELTSTAGSLTTQYGVPNSSSFSGSAATYYISPKIAPKICYARPNLKYGSNNKVDNQEGNFAGPATIWSPTKGFLVQSTESSSYYRNFPTTGANNLYFDLDIGGINGSALTWPTISQGGITATMTPSQSNSYNIRVTLTGPAATAAQQSSASPGSIVTPTLPQTFELVGYDSNNKVVLRYGFVLKQWFINRGDKWDTATNTSSWCRNIGGGYHLPQVKDLTNAVCLGVNASSFCEGAVGAMPQSSGNHFQRNIGSGFFTEWGNLYYCAAAGFGNFYHWTSDTIGSLQFAASSNNGNVNSYFPYDSNYGVCVYP